MVNLDNENDEIEVDITNDDKPEIEELELEEIEERSADKLKQLRKKLERCEEEKREILEESQRAKADFLNARKRLDEERSRDRVRHRRQHVEELLPLCDSFQMAMGNTEAWERADESWRKGIEGIHTQLLRLLDSYGVTTVDPQGETFDPYKHEAIGTEEVEDTKMQDKVVSVVQKGYEMTIDGNVETIRPARVTTGIAK
ncbi:nucleotide exchange factor GrpE [Candidatus Kaiserbacteria bacterium]|nr:nucleotide exchange factor GrpE [Candidatus Kaiserbacteria bacterium]